MAKQHAVTHPDQDEKTLLSYLKMLSGELGEVHKQVLNQLARAITERGWVQPIAKIVDTLVEEHDDIEVKRAFNDLVTRRMVYTDTAFQKFTGILGAVSLDRTEHRGHLEGTEASIDVYTFGGMDLLTLNTMCLKPVSCFTRCAHTGQEIRLRVDNEQIVDCNVHGLAGFAANWDGRRPLRDVAMDSPLFVDDAALEAWQAENPAIRGTAIPADLFLWVGLGQAQALAEARFRLIGYES